MNLSDLMTPEPITIFEEEDVMSNIKIFDDHKIHHLPVVNVDGDVIGMVSKKDFDNFTNISRVLASKDHPVLIRDIMTVPVFSYYEDVSIADAADAMVSNNIHAVVVARKDDDRMIGIITSTDLLRYLASLKGKL